MPVERKIPKLVAQGERLFVGFDSKKVDASVVELAGQVIEKKPEVRTNVSVEMRPLVRIEKGRFIGGAYQNQTLLPELVLSRGWGARRSSHILPDSSSLTSASKDAAVWDGAWFGGYLFDHFGHFLLEGLSRISEVEASSEPIIFFNPMRLKQMRDYMIGVFEHVGIDPKRVILCDKPIVVENLKYQQPTFEIRGFVNVAVRAFLKKPIQPVRKLGKLFLSRSKLNRPRKILNEELLERRLRDELGFRVVYMEQLGLAEKLQVLEGADLIVACAGSSLHTLIFGQTFKTVIMLCPQLPSLNFLLLDEIIDSRSIYISSAQEGISTPDYDWSIDVEKAFMTIKEYV